MFKLYNTLTKKKEAFKSILPNKVRMYSCGPTVYNYAHIGNLRAFIFADILRRYLKYKGYELVHVMNITDVDDKTIKDSQKENKSLKEFTEFYEKEFLKDLKKLNIEIPEIMPRATEHINEIIQLIEKLEKNGHTYTSKDGSVYFSIDSFKNYGKLANLDFSKLKDNAKGRMNKDEYDKENARDFALWKSYSKEDGDVFWETKYGKGRPGWHIECSAMSMKYLGEHFDIHTGGIDLVFPHHTNEIAQSSCATKRPFVNYWIHNAHLIVNGKKMSKSEGNFFTLRDLLDKGYDPIAIRYELLATHYRSKLDFREDNLDKIPETLQKFYDFIDKLDEVKNKEIHPEVPQLIKQSKEAFEDAMDDDLNISKALASIFEFMSSINKIMDKLSPKDAEKIKLTMESFDSVLGIMKHEKYELTKEEQSLIDQREQARKDKDWVLSDKLRDELKEKGIIVEDTKEGVRWKKLHS